MRVFVGIAGGQPDGREQGMHPLHALRLRLLACVDVQRLAHDLADGVFGVERRKRILENHLHPAALQALRFCQLGNPVQAAKLDPAGAGLHQAHQSTRQG